MWMYIRCRGTADAGSLSHVPNLHRDHVAICAGDTHYCVMLPLCTVKVTSLKSFNDRDFSLRPTRVHGNKAAKFTTHRAHRVSLIDDVRNFDWYKLRQIAALLSAAFYEDEELGIPGAATRPSAAAANATVTACRGGDDGGDGNGVDDRLCVHGGNGGGRSTTSLFTAEVLFGWASLFAVLLQHVMYGKRHLTVLASIDEEVVGCCGLTLETAPADVVAATGATQGSQYGLLTGLAVAPAYRRRGVASELLAAAAAAATARLPAPALLTLLVARTNKPALRLYERQGYQEAASWVDARWQAEAERGRVGKPRRLLLVKRLQA
ncbi:hypothetical protein VOLCADRAFT_103972 [Volvox carteri f. nagariensis]|uniref:N-acetyltransferase domain-containing protein n=1 Tax=Volvox carteri f. nagariensis TaxID=3068 RepID=D8TQF3_VOLCA|nr:uncharacterized protein VOLCADRAFT_103972 [Volvox carteri f. nagariensis]EFJ50524.1 hypothetical protein VOLCADRAFT_103972 [Volvox carteri f. nagariensis]|eukprot:XP_002948649.1 hypothetical protein VOLCADRAFT_103972 [Volvox carteri f. nagariensis]